MVIITQKINPLVIVKNIYKSQSQIYIKCAIYDIHM